MFSPSSHAQESATNPSIMYGILPDGQLKWYRHNAYLTGGGLENAGAWNALGSKTVGLGWDGFLTVFGF